MAELTDADKATIAAVLRETIAADRFPLSPRVRRWKAKKAGREAGGWLAVRQHPEQSGD